MNQSPKVIFQLDKPRTKAHNEMVQSDLFRVSKEAALLQMQEQLLSVQVDDVKALANLRRLEGARLFLQTMASLGVESEEQVSNRTANLDHTR